MEKKYHLTFATIIKNEGPYLQEWLEFHRLVGVEHFYIYDNGSTDDTIKVLKPYIDHDIITYCSFPGSKRQLPAYLDAVEKYRSQTRYMGFIDADEFVVPLKQNNLPDSIDDILSHDSDAVGVAMHWRMVGSSHLMKTPQGLVMENYTFRAKDTFKVNRHIKTICQPEYVLDFDTPHAPNYSQGKYSVSDCGDKVIGPFHQPHCYQSLAVYHYFTKSAEEFRFKMKRGKADSLGKRTMYDFFRHDKNEVYDAKMQQFVPQVKEKLYCKTFF